MGLRPGDMLLGGERFFWNTSMVIAVIDRHVGVAWPLITVITDEPRLREYTTDLLATYCERINDR